jgi:hypothetical protein
MGKGTYGSKVGRPPKKGKGKMGKMMPMPKKKTTKKKK